MHAKPVALSGLIPILLAVVSPAVAGTYEAVCGTAECRITLSPESIVTPYGVIPTTRVANWGGTGASSTDLVLGAAATYVLGPAGLVGFLAKTHDYNYLITGYDQQGNRTSVQIRFLNDKPAKDFVQEMVSITGLGMGQTRTASEIRELEQRVSQEGIGAVTKPRSHTLEQDLNRENKIKNYPSATKGKQCWSSYLKDNMPIKIWVDSNPEPAKKLQSRFADC